jgi:CxxC motif-containing protein (DUF1111 family)
VAAGWLALLTACAAPTNPGDPLPGLTERELAQFGRGQLEFERTFSPETGLGPLFNAESCVACHGEPASGGGGEIVEVHATAFDEEGGCDPLLDVGGPVYQQRVTAALRDALDVEEEPIPSRATARAVRTTPDVFGFGLLDAVPEEAILALADPDDRDGDGVSGRVNRFFDGRVGRFGRKALIPTLREFNEGAFLIEQGVTTPANPVEGTVAGIALPGGVDPAPEPEIDQVAIDSTDAFVRFLAPPASLPLPRSGRRGRGVFRTIGCAACHVPTLKTGEHLVHALSSRRVEAYTDLLLHDMGPELADICLGEATPSEFRTEPLMGLRFSRRFLHDGRAVSIEEAIRMHDGEAAPARDRFDALSDADRQALLEFLKAL